MRALFCFFCSLRGGIRRAVPKGFPFFHVEWEDGGYANIIEGEVRRGLRVTNGVLCSWS